MKVKCVKTKLEEIKDKKIYNYLKSFINSDDYDYCLDVGKIYQVYGISVIEGFMSYYILRRDIEPYSEMSCFFNVVESSIPDDWTLVFQDTNNFQFLPKEWAKNEMFYENLIHLKKDNEQEIFKDIIEKYKKYDIYQDNDIKEIGKILDNKWIQCPNCLEVWEQTDKIGIINCNKCNLKMNNPFSSKL